ncbi:hypothetical protein FocTR4_00012160 [Fusarium oxysporum f. sp. cubense]|uniref:Uncharacterized protein n=1 Tax=Fusarium oxysporum f. sp. cubense TaxID=61366 RepID=A0A5C6SG23_FUSOC|nr:hypothetical protein FocTR4_00012160 [Fusarium oxysporum f. sp. cubense]
MPVSRLWLPLLVCTAAFWISEAHTTLPNTHNVVSITPHDQYSSSIGVLGCKVDTNRIAYWPLEVGCDGICVKVANKGRFLHLLRIDKSQGAGLGSMLQLNSTAKNVMYATGELIPA